MKLFRSFSCLMALSFLLSGCFKPEVSGNGDDADLLYGFWEVVHVADDDYWYTLYSDGTEGNKETYVNSASVTPNDGQEEYYVWHISESFATLIATDCADAVEMLEIPIPYTYNDGKLFGLAFSGDYVNYSSITKLDSNTLVLYTEDIGTDYVSDDDYSEYERYSIGTYEHYTRTTTLNRIEIRK